MPRGRTPPEGGPERGAAGEGVSGSGAPRGMLHGAAWFPERQQAGDPHPREQPGHRAGGENRVACSPTYIWKQEASLAPQEPPCTLQPPQGRRAWGHHRGSAPPNQGSAGMSSTSPHARSTPSPIFPVRPSLAPCLGRVRLTSQTLALGMLATPSRCLICGGALAT